MVPGEMVPDLNGGMESDGLGFPCEDDLPIFQTSLSGHHFGDTLAHRIGHLWVTRRFDGDERPWGDPRSLECRGPFEDEVVRIEVLHEDRVARGKVLRADEASADVGNEDPAYQDAGEDHNHEGGHAELPCCLDRLLRMEEVSSPLSHPDHAD